MFHSDICIIDKLIQNWSRSTSRTVGSRRKPETQGRGKNCTTFIWWLVKDCNALELSMYQAKSPSLWQATTSNHHTSACCTLLHHSSCGVLRISRQLNIPLPVQHTISVHNLQRNLGCRKSPPSKGQPFTFLEVSCCLHGSTVVHILVNPPGQQKHIPRQRNKCYLVQRRPLWPDILLQVAMHAPLG